MAGIICTLIVTAIVTLIIPLLVYMMISEVKKRKKRTANFTKKSSSIVVSPDDSTPQNIKEPIYDDIELTKGAIIIDLSSNVAYVCSNKKSL